MKVTVWNENVHEKEIPLVTELYPGGLHGYIANFVKDTEGVELVRTATLDDPECGLTDEVLADTDVLIWWGHAAHGRVPDEIVDRVQNRILQGMGLIVLHSGHESKIFQRMMGTACGLRWGDDTHERMSTCLPSHPIAEGIPEQFEIGTEETYGEFFDIPQPDDLIFISWFDNGNVFRGGCTFHRGYGKIFYFQPGHETNLSFQNPYVQKIIQNAVKWTYNKNSRKELGSAHI